MLKPFDTSDVDAHSAAIESLERRFVRANELRARAFAQGFKTAVENIKGVAEEWPEWLEYFTERAG